jgi:hypothetical protein
VQRKLDMAILWRKFNTVMEVGMKKMKKLSRFVDILCHFMLLLYSKGHKILGKLIIISENCKHFKKLWHFNSFLTVKFADGCPNDCSNNGVCTLGQQGYSCKCRSGWKGEACDVSMEMQCKDHVDNDGGKIKQLW